MHDDADPRFLLLAVHRGQMARDVRRDIRADKEGAEFELVEALGSPTPGKSFARWRSVAVPSVQWIVRGKSRDPIVLRVLLVERLTWPPGAEVDQRKRRDRREAARGAA